MGNDLRTALSAAITSGKVETPAAPVAEPAAAPVTPVEPVAPAAAPTAPAVARDESGKFTSKPAEPAAPITPTDTKQGTATAPKFKPPQSWKPAIREKWSTLPEDVQEEIERTEKAAADRVRRAAEAEKGYGAFRQALTPYEAQLRASGKAIPEALGEALAFAAKVRNGSPQERAAALADVIAEATQAGVKVEDLDTILAQRLQGGQPAAPKPQEFKDPRFDQFMAQIAQQQRAKVAQSIAEFSSKHEFFADVEADIAGLLESGIAKDLDSAYDYAISLPKHAEIRSVLEQRKAAEAARTGTQATERAQNAASSVRPSPVVASGSAPTDLRAQLRAAMSSR